MNLNDIVRLWYKTQMGNIHECRKNQLIFADIMWDLYNNKNDIRNECWHCDACFACNTWPCECEEIFDE